MRKLSSVMMSVLVLLGIALGVRRFSPVSAPPPPVSSPEQSPTSLFDEPLLPAEDITQRGFQSGGLGLSRRAWEILRGQPAKPEGEWVQYQGQTYAVLYQYDMVWQLKCTWKPPGLALPQARAQARRYLPLDSRYQKTLLSPVQTATITDQYFSQTLAQHLAPTSRVTAAQSQGTLDSQGMTTVVHTVEKDRVIATVFLVGSGEK